MNLLFDGTVLSYNFLFDSRILGQQIFGEQCLISSSLATDSDCMTKSIRLFLSSSLSSPSSSFSPSTITSSSSSPSSVLSSSSSSSSHPSSSSSSSSKVYHSPSIATSHSFKNIAFNSIITFIIFF